MSKNKNAPDVDSKSWKDVLVADRWRLLAVGLVVASGAVYFGYEPEMPRFVKLYLLTGLIGAALAYVPAQKIVEYLYSPSYTYLLDVSSEGNDITLWKLPPELWRDLSVNAGELFRLRAAVPVWECLAYAPPGETETYHTETADGEPVTVELEDNACLGTWRGSVTDYELIQDRNKIAEIRHILEPMSQETLKYRVMQNGIVRRALRAIVMQFVASYESETIYSGDEIEKSVERALKHWSVDGSDTDKHEERQEDDTEYGDENAKNGHDEGFEYVGEKEMEADV
jgi:hypothetical protein